MLLIFVLIFFIWDVIEEILQIYFSFKRLNGFKRWAKKELKRFQLDEKKNVPYGNNSNENEYSLIEKEARAIENLPLPYKNWDNLIDWITILFQLASLVTHFIDVSNHTNNTAQTAILLIYSTTLIIWIRNLLSVNGATPGVDLICMVRLIGSQFYRFFFLYMRIIIPFMLILWAMFGGLQIPQNVMSSNWKECESIKYSLPYYGALNVSYFSEFCNSSIQVQGFE